MARQIGMPSNQKSLNAAARGYRLMMNHYPMSRCRGRNGLLRELGKRAEDLQTETMITFMAHIADTEEEAMEQGKAALQEHAGAFRKVMKGDQWNTDGAGDVSTLLDMCENDDWRDVFRRRTLICSPEQAAERIQHYLDLGFTEISFTARFAGLTHDQTMTTIRRISDEVVPMLGLSREAAE